MNRIEARVAALAPRGVVLKPLGEVADWRTGEQLNRSSLSESGDYPVINGGVSPSGYHSKYNTARDTITISQGGASAGYVSFQRTDFWAGAHCYVITPITTKIEKAYLYYFLKSEQASIQAMAQGAGIPGLSRKSIARVRVPLPPLGVQREIVKVLDTFTELEAVLEAELEARRQQYKHYRRSLLAFAHSNKALFAPLGDLVDFTNGKPHERFVDPDGDIALITAKFISTQGRSTRFVRSADALTPAHRNEIAMVMSDLPSGRALARAFYVDSDDGYTVNQRVCLLRVRDQQVADPRFLFYIIDRNKQLLSYDSGVDQTHLKKGEILAVEIPVPPLGEQRRIVAILDSFDMLVNDLSVGLPAELNARRQQYEHYRARLLTFPEAA